MEGAQITVDTVATRGRIARLRRYVQKSLLKDDAFLCGQLDACRASAKPHHQFREGTMSHVGHRYDLTLDGKALRVMVVGQESGLPKDPESSWASRVTMESRHHQVHDVTGLERRYYARDGWQGRNPHMRGTTSALRLIFGTGLGWDYEGEFVHPANGKRFHCFDGFALVNRLLCSTGPLQTSKGTPTPTMFANCGTHFAATVEILEPTLVILQGRQVAKRVAPILAFDRRHDEHLHEAHLGDLRMLVCTFSHPSAHGALRWGDNPGSPYLEQVVAPTVRKALRAL